MTTAMLAAVWGCALVGLVVRLASMRWHLRSMRLLNCQRSATKRRLTPLLR